MATGRWEGARALQGSRLAEGHGPQEGPVRRRPTGPVWKTSDFVVVRLCSTTSPSLPHGAGLLLGVWGWAAPHFLAPLPCTFSVPSLSPRKLLCTRQGSTSSRNKNGL